MPSKKRKYNARFPPGRIKKIMQTDEEVGKVAQAVPIIISRTLELFVESLVTKAMDVTNAKNAKTLTPSHMKQCILSESRFDFLKDLVKDIPDTNNEEYTYEPTSTELTTAVTPSTSSTFLLKSNNHNNKDTINKSQRDINSIQASNSQTISQSQTKDFNYQISVPPLLPFLNNNQLLKNSAEQNSSVATQSFTRQNTNCSTDVSNSSNEQNSDSYNNCKQNSDNNIARNSKNDIKNLSINDKIDRLKYSDDDSQDDDEGLTIDDSVVDS